MKENTKRMTVRKITTTAMIDRDFIEDQKCKHVINNDVEWAVDSVMTYVI